MSSNTTSKADTKSKLDSQSQLNSRSEEATSQANSKSREDTKSQANNKSQAKSKSQANTKSQAKTNSQANSKSQINSKSQLNSRNQLSSKSKEEWEGEGAGEDEDEDELELEDLVDEARAETSELLLDDDIYDVGGEEGDFIADSSHQSGLMIDDEDEVDEVEEGEEDEAGEDEADDEDLDAIRFSELELSESNDDQADTPKSAKKVLSSDAESSPESENDDGEAENPEIPAEYWQVQRLIKYVKAGNPTATIIAMSSLRDFNLRDYYVQIAIKEAGGLEVLLNILETDENRCKIAALLVLREISSNPEISRNIYNMRVYIF